jgi:hypothetical protein
MGDRDRISLTAAELECAPPEGPTTDDGPAKIIRKTGSGVLELLRGRGSHARGGARNRSSGGRAGYAPHSTSRRGSEPGGAAVCRPVNNGGKPLTRGTGAWRITATVATDGTDAPDTGESVVMGGQQVPGRVRRHEALRSEVEDRNAERDGQRLSDHLAVAVSPVGRRAEESQIAVLGAAASGGKGGEVEEGLAADWPRKKVADASAVVAEAGTMPVRDPSLAAAALQSALPELRLARVRDTSDVDEDADAPAGQQSQEVIDGVNRVTNGKHDPRRNALERGTGLDARRTHRIYRGGGTAGAEPDIRDGERTAPQAAGQPVGNGAGMARQRGAMAQEPDPAAGGGDGEQLFEGVADGLRAPGALVEGEPGPRAMAAPRQTVPGGDGRDRNDIGAA